MTEQPIKYLAEVEVPIEAFLPSYRHLLKSNVDLNFLWGGRDSGKTRHIAMQLLILCLSLPYFRCVLIRKVFNTIKDSQWQQIKDVAVEWGIDHLFTFKESPLEIICVNGNKFLCRGMDDPGKLKSISNPSHCWCEEMNQLELDDFITIITSLRYNGGRVQNWCSFNPECYGDFNEFWLYKTFFSQEKNIYRRFIGKWQHTIPPTSKAGPGSKAKVFQFTYQCTWTTFRDNPYCRPERIVVMMNMAALDKYYETVYTNGLWGNRQVKDPFCYCFDRKIHLDYNVVHQNSLETIASFDFNVNPITCGIYQHSFDDIWCVESIKLNDSNIYTLCDVIMKKYPGAMFLVTGDASGNNRSALSKDNLNYYQVIKNELFIGLSQIKTPLSNPRISENRVIVNAVLKKKRVHMHPENCKELIFDCENVTVNDVGDIDKGNRNDPKKRADHLDHFRYYLNTFHKDVLKML